MLRRIEVVIRECIRCGLCAERAPENLAMPNDSPAAEVIRQPVNEEEEEACVEASDYCPMGGLQVHDPDPGPADQSGGGV